MNFHRITLLARSIVAGALATSFCLAPTVAWATCRGTVIPAANAGFASNLFSVSAVSATDAWAVGAYSSAPEPSPISQLIEHWNGTSWSVVPNPSIGTTSRLTDIAALSSTNAWAVGSAPDNTQALIEHWNGIKWTRVASPNVSGQDFLEHLAVLSSSSIWAIGQYSIFRCFLLNCHWIFAGSFTEYWNGSTWTAQIAGSFNLQDVSRAGFHNAWAVGVGAGNTTLTEYWNGTSWSVVPSPNEGADDGLFGVARVPASSRAWAVGSFESPTNVTQPLIENFDGSQWSIVASPTFPANSFLNDVAATGPSNAWAVGSRSDGPLLAMHWNGTTWSTVSLASQQIVENLFGLAKIPGSPGFWGVGFAGSDPLVELLHC